MWRLKSRRVGSIPIRSRGYFVHTTGFAVFLGVFRGVVLSGLDAIRLVTPVYGPELHRNMQRFDEVFIADLEIVFFRDGLAVANPRAYHVSRKRGRCFVGSGLLSNEFALCAIRVENCGASGWRAESVVESVARESRAPQKWRRA